ncbi:MAG TPA: hypothetical protein VM186_04580 [Planctomycetota bacterium]|nr:hypothetical protein [Planctomycetota bacterium]
MILLDWIDMVRKASLCFRRRALPLAWHCLRKWHFEKSRNNEGEQMIVPLSSNTHAFAACPRA